MVKLVGPVVKPGSGNPMVSAWHGDRVPDADQRGLRHPNLSHHSCPLRPSPIRRGDDELGNVSPTPFPSPCRRACGSVGRGRPRAKALIRGRDAVPGTHKIERSDRLLARFDLIKISALADVFGAQVVLHGSSV